MKFVRIEMLSLIWSVPILMLLVFYGFRRRNRILNRFASGKGRLFAEGDAAPTRRRMKWGLLFTGLLFLIFSMAGPQYGYQWQEMEQTGVDIIIALDCSKSMLANDIQPSRLDRAKREVVDLLHMLKGDRVGLVAFAGTAFLQCPLTVDYQAFYLFLDTLTPGFLPVGGTDLYGAIETAANGFNPEDTTEKAVILITDGENTSPDPKEAIEKAKNRGIKIFTIGVGKGTGVPVPSEDGGLVKDAQGKIVVTRLDENMLKQIATATEGLYVRSVAGDMDLETIYEKEIRGQMEASVLTSGKKQVWEDRFQWFLIMAIILFMIDIFLPQTAKTKSTGKIIAGFFLCMVMVHASGASAATTYSMVEKGIAAYDKGDYETALKHFVDAQVKSPDKAEIYYNIGNTYYKLKDYDAAITNYNHALNTTDEILKQKARYNLGNAKFRKQQVEDAISEYENALHINPEDQKAKENLAFARKVLEHQQQQQSRDASDKSSEEKNKKQKENQQGDQEKEGREAPSEANKHQQGQEEGQPQQQEEQSSASQANEGKSDDKDDGNRQKFGDKMEDQTQSPEQPPDSGPPDSSQSRPSEKKAADGESKARQQQAERMLNRLKDSPGKALIPAYAPREVEKDW